jgi:hypothetical protein
MQQDHETGSSEAETVDDHISLLGLILAAVLVCMGGVRLCSYDTQPELNCFQDVGLCLLCML